jgi:hypothetical protein
MLFGLASKPSADYFTKVKGEFVDMVALTFMIKKESFTTKLTIKVKESGYRYLK